MKKIFKSVLFITISVLFLFFAESCIAKVVSNNDFLWQNAIYTENTELGSGKTCVKVKIEAGEKSIDITLKTDKTTLGDALFENNLIEGENGEYGLYVKSVNGILADYDKDKSYWAFFKDGELMMTGVDATEISNGEKYELVYTK